VTCFEVRRHPDLLCKLAEWPCPLGGRGRQRGGCRVGATMLEDRVDLASQASSVELRKLSDQGKVDEVLGAGAGAPTLVDARLGMELFGDL
jgi:hypothetical protein